MACKRCALNKTCKDSFEGSKFCPALIYVAIAGALIVPGLLLWQLMGQLNI